MMQVHWAVSEADVIKSLTKLELLLSGPGLTTFLGTTVAPYLKARAKDRFVEEGDDVTGPWAPLKPATVAIRESLPFQIGGEHPINRRTGELEEWVTRGDYSAYPTGIGASLDYPKSEPTGELRKKMETAQRGRSDPKTVKRPVLGVNENDMLFVLAALAAAVEGTQ